MEAYVEEARKEFFTQLQKDEARLLRAKATEVKDLKAAITLQEQIQEELLRKLKTAETAVGTSVEEINRREKGRAAYCTSQPLRSKDLQDQKKLLRTACKTTSSLLESVISQVTEIQNVQTKLLEFEDSLNQKVEQLVGGTENPKKKKKKGKTTTSEREQTEEEESEKDKKALEDWNKGLAELNLITATTTDCLKHAVRLATLLESDDIQSRKGELNSVCKKLVQAATGCVKQSGSTEKLFRESPNLLSLQKKWAHLEGKLFTVLKELDAYETHKKEWDKDIEEYTAAVEKSKEELEKVQTAANAIIAYAWKVYSKICGTTRGKRQREDKIEYIEQEIKRLRPSYGNELERIEKNIHRFSQQSPSYFFGGGGFQANPSSSSSSPSTPSTSNNNTNNNSSSNTPTSTVILSRNSGFEHLKSPWSMRFQARTVKS